MKNNFNKLARYALVTEIIFLFWLATAVQGTIGWIYFLLELGIFFLLILLIINHRSGRYVLLGGSYSIRDMVDVIIMTKEKSIKEIERTMRSAKEIIYSNIRFHVIDDENREEIKKLAKRYKYDYLVRMDRETNILRAAALNYGLINSYGNFILVLNGGQKVKSLILEDLLGHFKDKKIAYVTTRQSYFEYMQLGKNTRDVSISSGSGVIYRRSALLAIGGFSEWNILEDLYTSYLLNSHGFKGIYIDQPYTMYETLTDLESVSRQQSMRSLDSLRFLIWKMPLLNKNLTFLKRLHYMETGYFYFVGGFIMPAIFLIIYYSLFSNVIFISSGFLFLIFKTISFYFTLNLYKELDQGLFSFKLMGKFYPIYLWSLLLALLHIKPEYKKKTKIFKNGLILSQALTIVIGIIVVFYNLTHFYINQFLLVDFFWMGTIIYWIWP